MSFVPSPGPGRSLAGTGGVVALGALIVENLLLLTLLFHPEGPAIRAVLAALFKATVVVMMHNWTAVVTALIGVGLMTYLGLSIVRTPEALREETGR